VLVLKIQNASPMHKMGAFACTLNLVPEFGFRCVGRSRVKPMHDGLGDSFPNTGGEDVSLFTRRHKFRTALLTAGYARGP
jgi:hypothetical protein